MTLTASEILLCPCQPQIESICTPKHVCAFAEEMDMCRAHSLRKCWAPDNVRLTDLMPRTLALSLVLHEQKCSAEKDVISRTRQKGC